MFNIFSGQGRASPNHKKYYFILRWLTKVLESDILKYWKGRGSTGSPCGWWECALVQSLWKVVWHYFVELNIMNSLPQ